MSWLRHINGQRGISLTASLTAVTLVSTLVVRIPFAPTRGYFTLADVGV